MPEQKDWTRVRNEAGHEYSTLVVVDGLKVLDKPAANIYGDPLPPKHNRPLRALTDASGKPVSEMTAPELRAYANAVGVVVEGDKPRKEEILSAIAEHEGDGTEGDAPASSDTPSTPPPGEGTQAS